MEFKEEIIHTRDNPAFDYVEGSLQLIEMKGLSIDYVNLEHERKHKKSFAKKGKHIELFFMLQGVQKYYTDHRTIARTSTGRYGFFYMPEINGDFDFDPFEHKYHSLGIEFSLGYLEDLFKNDLEILGSFGKCLYTEETAFFANNIPISQKIKWLIKELLSNPYSGILKPIYIENKINEILLLVIASKNDNRVGSELTSDIFNRSDIEKLYYIRETISNNIDSPYSLKKLSRISGLNEFKLKKGFKEVFDKTVFQYIFEERMQVGKSMLLDTNLSVSEISTHVGYKNATHFTAAFKKHYHILPSQLRK